MVALFGGQRQALLFYYRESMRDGEKKITQLPVSSSTDGVEVTVFLLEMIGGKK
jgi:hypothetical protein